MEGQPWSRARVGRQFSGLSQLVQSHAWTGIGCVRGHAQCKVKALEHHVPLVNWLFNTNVKGTFLGMSESDEASKGLCLYRPRRVSRSLPLSLSLPPQAKQTETSQSKEQITRTDCQPSRRPHIYTHYSYQNTNTQHN